MPPKRKRSDFEEEAAPKPAENNVIQARDNDCLFGRGDSINRHPGNKKFRELVDMHKKTYLTSRFKQEKRMIADSIMKKIHSLDPPGRFLAKDANGQWQIVAEARAREKTLQALREKARVVRSQADADEPPRQKLPPEPAWGTQAPQTQQKQAASFYGGNAAVDAANTGSPGLPYAQTNLASRSAPDPSFLAPRMQGQGSQAPPSLFSSALAQSMSASQTLDMESISSFLASAAAAAAAIAGPEETAARTQESHASTLVGAPQCTLHMTANSAASTSPSSHSSGNTAPMAPPPTLPSSIRDARGNLGIQNLSNRLMPNRPANDGRSDLMPPPPARQVQEEKRTGSSSSDVLFTPRPQLQGNGLGFSPFSSGTFEALQRVAFPESPTLEGLFSFDRPFSPRRLPPNQNNGRLQSSSNGTLPNTQLQMQQGETPPFSRLPAASRRRLTPHPREQSFAGQANAQDVEYMMPNFNSVQAQSPIVPQQQQQQAAVSPSEYSPLPVYHAGNHLEEATPPCDTPFSRRLDLLRLLDDPAAMPSPSMPERNIPLPRASLTRRASFTRRNGSHPPRRESNTDNNNEDVSRY